MVVVSKSKVYCVNYDWLSFSVRLKNADAEIECPDNWRMDIFPGTNVYKNRAILRDPNGCKVLTFCWCPYSKVLMPNICTVQIANSCLYDADLTFVMPLLNACVECVFNSWSRIDICVDYECSDRQLAMIRKLNSGALFVSAKSEGSVWWHETNWNGVKSKFPHCLTWGSATSMFKWKLYNKSREQNQEQNQDGNSEKPYIVAMWKDAGFDVSKVWRLELSMTDSGGLRLDGHKLSFEEILAEWFKFRVFNDMYERRFWVIQTHAISDTYVFNNFTEQEVDKLWAEAVYMYKQDPNMSLYLGKDYIDMAKVTQKEYKSFNNDDDITFLKDAVFEREYIFNINDPTYKGNYIFRNYDDFYKQVTNDTIPDVDGINLIKSKVDIIPQPWIKKYLLDVWKTNKSHKYISFAVEWDLKVIKLKGKVENCYVRREN